MTTTVAITAANRRLSANRHRCCTPLRVGGSLRQSSPVHGAELTSFATWFSVPTTKPRTIKRPGPVVGVGLGQQHPLLVVMMPVAVSVVVGVVTIAFVWYIFDNGGLGAENHTGPPTPR